MKRIVQMLVSLLLAGTILWWLYRDFPFSTVMETLRYGMNWGWMLFSLLFGIFPQILRGWRWSMTLEPLGEYPSRRNCVYAVFMSFAASLIVPRIGEFSRCVTLKNTDGISFSKSLGTVVTERIVDSLFVLAVLSIIFLLEFPLFMHFFDIIGLGSNLFLHKFTPAGVVVTLTCAAAALVLLFIVLRRFHLHKKFKETFRQVWEGIISLRKVKNLSVYLIETIVIWLCYFLHFYLAFYAFGFTAHLGLEAGILSFCMITVAVLVPTPNGAGPWHFAVKVVLMLFGVTAHDAILFALIVHAMQTLLVVILGLYGYAAIFLHKKHVVASPTNNNPQKY